MELKIGRVDKWRKLQRPGRILIADKISMLKTIEPGRTNTISADGAWDETEISVDSRATETVVLETVPTSISTSLDVASRNGV